MAKSIKVVLELDNKDFKKGIAQSKKEVSGLEKSGKQSFANLGTAFKAIIGAAAIQQFVTLGDTFTNMTNQLKAVTNSTLEYENALKLVKEVSKSTRSDIGATASLFSSLTVASDALGLKQTEIARITETFGKALVISGADAGAAAGAITQFGQALAGGVLRGDEFNSINETSSEFMKQLAIRLQVPRGELKKLAEQGVLTADIIAQATLEMSQSVDQKFGKTTATIGQSFTMLRNDLIGIFGELQEKTGIFTTLSKVILLVADNMKILFTIMAVIFSVKTAQAIFGIVKAMQALKVATKAQTIAQAALLSLSGPAGWAALAGGAVALGTAVVGLNALFDDTNESLDEMAGKDMGTLPDGTTPSPKVSTPDGPSISAGMLDAAKAKVIQDKKDAAAATVLLNKQKKIKDQIIENAQKVKEIRADETAGLQNTIKQLELNFKMIGLNDRQKEQLQQIADLKADQLEAEAKIRSLQLSTDDAENIALQGAQVALLNKEYKEYIALILEAQEKNYEASTTFGAGWTQAFANFKENVDDSSQFGAKVFNTMSQGFTDSIMTFVETGKLSFQDLFKSLMTEIIKMMANKMFLSLFGGGGVFASMFAGMFANGGYIPAGKFGIAGERGPELINGPANVTSTKETAGMFGNGGTAVTYNINAVDARSFKQLVAADPEFIYNVTKVGQRRLPI
jgi:lambda family phage tail tape measure protein